MKTFDDLKAKYPRLLRPGFCFECHTGWLSILDRYFEVVDREMPEDAVYNLRQVKEKLGSLRIYDSSYNETMSSVAAITHAHRLAEARSYHTCELCGQPGVWSERRGCLTTVCAEHAEKDGHRAEPCEGEGFAYRDNEGVWHRYNPELDAFEETDAPAWDHGKSGATS